MPVFINNNFKLPSTGEIRFSWIREMYGNLEGTQYASESFNQYHRNGNVVVNDSYGEIINGLDYTAENTAHNIPESGELRISHFRGAFKEFVFNVNGNGYYLNANQNRTYNRYYKLVINNILYTVGDGLHAMRLGSSDPSAIFIVENRSTIYGGPGAPGTGGAGGAGGTGGTGGTGNYFAVLGTNSNANQVYRVNGNPGSNGSDGRTGDAGTNGGDGGNCLDIFAYPQNRPLYLFNKGTLKPGGGGGGGTGGGAGAGGGGGGGGGGTGGTGHEITPSLVYVSGGKGGTGREGNTGGTGISGPPGKRGAYYNPNSNGETVDTSNYPSNITGNVDITVWPDNSGPAGYPGELGNPFIRYPSGNGGSGGTGGYSKIGGGYYSGGGGGNYGQGGNAGGNGQSKYSIVSQSGGTGSSGTRGNPWGQDQLPTDGGPGGAGGRAGLGSYGGLGGAGGVVLSGENNVTTLIKINWSQ